MRQCSVSGVASQIHQLFVHMMVNCRVSDLKKLWTDHKSHMMDDILLIRRRRSGKPDLLLNDKQTEYYSLAGIY